MFFFEEIKKKEDVFKYEVILPGWTCLLFKNVYPFGVKHVSGFENVSEFITFSNTSETILGFVQAPYRLWQRFLVFEESKWLEMQNKEVMVYALLSSEQK